MRGRANDPNVQRAKSSRHARRAHYCSCGKIVRGNGGQSAHQAAHDRRNETDNFITVDAYRAKFPEVSG